MADNSLLDIARSLCKQAAQNLLEARSQPHSIENKGFKDWVSSLDRDIEDWFRHQLAHLTPEIPLLGEESGGVDAHTERYWCLDPIDGTVNFLSGLPLFGISLALIENGQSTVAVIELPALDQQYEAIRGEGAWCNGKRLQASAQTDLNQSVIAMGDFASKTLAPQSNQLLGDFFVEMAHQAMRLRLLGASVIDLTALAQGHVQASLQFYNHPWDVQAGVLIAREAGCCCFDLDGSEHTLSSKVTFCCANAKLKDGIVAISRKLKLAERFV